MASVFNRLRTHLLSWRLLAPLAWAVSIPLQAATYVAGVEQTDWQITPPSPLNCEMSQRIPYIGEAIFAHRAGEQLKFRLNAIVNTIPAGQAELVSAAPQWKPGTAVHSLGQVRIRPDEDYTVEVGARQALMMLESLKRGMQPTIMHTSQDARFDSVQIGISAIRFQHAYADFQRCVAELLPVNFDQIASSNVRFGPGKAELNGRHKDHLKLVARYVEADPTVQYLFIDGHSDNNGTRRDNRQLSKQRADAVLNYMLSIGVPEEMIESRYHGERYPVATNRTAAGRARNRRVTIRLERG